MEIENLLPKMEFLLVFDLFTTVSVKPCSILIFVFKVAASFKKNTNNITWTQCNNYKLKVTFLLCYRDGN